MRLAVFTDHSYRRAGGVVYGDRAFVRFLVQLTRHVDRLMLVGRLVPEPGTSYYPLPPEVGLVGLPHYESLAKPLDVLRALATASRRFWRALDDIDVVWLMGPHPVAIVFALLAFARGRRVVLGVRQDMPRYVRSRHPHRRSLHLAAAILEAAYRLIARRAAVVTVGPELASHYRHARQLLELSVSMVSEADVIPAERDRREYGDELRVLTVGRLEEEKNPLLLAEILARVSGNGRGWRLVVCGEGPMEGELRARLADLGLSDNVELRGYVPIDGGLLDLYRESHAFLHVSWTEGLPQVLFEAFAARLPVVATAVGGVPAAAGDAALLVPPGDADSAAEALGRLMSDAELRRRLVEAGAERVRRHTLEAESARLAEFLAGATA